MSFLEAIASLVVTFHFTVCRHVTLSESQKPNKGQNISTCILFFCLVYRCNKNIYRQMKPTMHWGFSVSLAKCKWTEAVLKYSSDDCQKSTFLLYGKHETAVHWTEPNRFCRTPALQLHSLLVFARTLSVSRWCICLNSYRPPLQVIFGVYPKSENNLTMFQCKTSFQSYLFHPIHSIKSF